MPAHVPTRSRTTATVLGTVFVDVIGFAMILPILPGTAASLGASPTLIGILVASYSAVQLLLAPVWGRVSDRIGRRPVLLLGLTGSAVSYVVFALAGSWPLLLLSRLLDGGSGATTNVAQAWLADETTPERRSRAMGQVGAAVGLGFIVGPILGGITATRGVALTGWVAAAITLVNLVVAMVALPPAPPRREAPGAIPAAAGRHQLLVPLAVLFLATLAFTVMYVVFPLWGEATVGADRSTVGYWFAFIGFITALTQGGILGRLVSRLGEAGTTRIGAGLLAAGLMCIATTAGGPAWQFYGVLALLGAGYGLAGPPMLGLISRATGAHRQGRVLGVAQSVASMARIVGPVVAGAAMGVVDARFAFVTSGALALGALACTLVPATILRPGLEAGR
ncbi:MAG TPA: MFS transporter [Gemmatimonadales bacterium]|nr:MFS transporter [Gemmatimonadales bacterium]